MRVGIYNPYLDGLGGGEKYVFDIASSLSTLHDVTVFWQDPNLKKEAIVRFNLDLNRVNFSPTFSSATSLLEKYSITKKFDAFFYTSDGSIPLLFSKRNFLIIQFPVEWVKGNSIANKLKLRSIKNIIVYTQFVKNYIDKEFNCNAIVIPPAVSSMYDKNIKKENIILSVGRFTQGMNTKKQDVLIDAFKSISKSLKSWRFVLIGSHLPQDKGFVEELQQKAKNFPIEIYPNVSKEILREYYNKAKLFWHGTGFGEDLNEHPEKAEHFGIATVEAMSAKVIPLVFNGGGQKEIVINGRNGFVWESIDELLDKTLQIIKDNNLQKEIIKNALVDVERYSDATFAKNILSLL